MNICALEELIGARKACRARASDDCNSRHGRIEYDPTQLHVRSRGPQYKVYGMSMGKKKEFIIGISLALLISLIINLPIAGKILFENELSFPDILMESRDEAYYLARIREVGDGYPLVGHPYVYEQREALYNLGTVAEIIAALPMSLFNFTIKETSILGDFFFPFLLALILWFALSPILPKWPWRLLLLSIIFLGANMAFWKRPVSPQVTTIFLFLYLWGFLHPKRSTSSLCALRSGMAGIMLFTYPYHWLFALPAEALLALHDLKKEKGLPASRRGAKWMDRLLPSLIPFLLFALPWYSLMRESQSDPAYAETLLRLGLIAHHFPKGPGLMAGLLFTLLLGLFFSIYTKKKKEFLPLAFLLLGGILALSSPVILGKEVEFSSHFERFLPLFIWITAIWALSILLKKKDVLRNTIILLGLSVVLTMTAMGTVKALKEAERSASTVERQETKELLFVLQALPPESVILTEPTMSQLLPIYTSHYPFFSPFTRLHVVLEEELLLRAKIQSTLLPHLPPHSDRTLYGTAHFNLALHKEGLCKIQNIFRSNQKKKNCDMDPRDFIVASWTSLYEQLSFSTDKALQGLKERHTGFALLRGVPPPTLAPFLEKIEQVGEWELYRISE